MLKKRIRMAPVVKGQKGLLAINLRFVKFIFVIHSKLLSSKSEPDYEPSQTELQVGKKINYLIDKLFNLAL